MQRGRFCFLIVGAGRGGTSLLAGLLDSHPDLEVGFERFSVAHLMGRRIAGRWRLPTWRWRSDLFGSRVRAFRSACQNEAAQTPDRFWGNKITTEQLAGLEDHNRSRGRPIDVIPRFFDEAMADLRVIFLLRDGRSCVRSKVRRTGQSLELACSRWRYSVEVWRHLSGRANSVCIRFEDLLARPADTLQPVCDLLEIPFEEQMLSGTRSGKMLPEYRHNTLDPSKALVEDLPPEQMALIEADLRACGYLPAPSDRDDG